MNLLPRFLYSRLPFAKFSVLILSLCLSTTHLTAFEVEPIPAEEVRHFSGDAEEMGTSQATKDRQAIRHLNDSWLKPKLSKIPILGKLYFNVAADLTKKHVSEPMMEEMQALSRGTDVEFQNVYIANAFADLFELIGIPFGCSTLTAVPERSATGAMLVGRNLDYAESDDLRAHWRPVIFDRPGTHKIVAVEVPGYAGILTGINAKGVSMARLTSKKNDRNRRGVPSTLIFREVLEKANSARHAIELYLEYPRTVPINIAISDSQEALVLEVSPKFHQIRTPNDAGMLYSANHYETEVMNEGKLERDHRWPILSRLDNNTTPVSLDDIASTLCTAGGSSKDGKNNVLTVLIDYASMKLFFATGSKEQPRAACSKTYKAIDLGALFAN